MVQNGGVTAQSTTPSTPHVRESMRYGQLSQTMSLALPPYGRSSFKRPLIKRNAAVGAPNNSTGLHVYGQWALQKRSRAPSAAVSVSRYDQSRTPHQLAVATSGRRRNGPVTSPASSPDRHLAPCDAEVSIIPPSAVNVTDAGASPHLSPAGEHSDVCRVSRVMLSGGKET